MFFFFFNDRGIVGGFEFVDCVIGEEEKYGCCVVM